jgi:hypothetical protein
MTLAEWAEVLSRSRNAAEPPRDETTGDAPSSLGAAKEGHEIRDGRVEPETERAVLHHPMAIELLSIPEALLTRTHLRELGLERRAVDAVFRALPVVALPGYSRPLIRAEQFLELVERSTYDDDRVRPSAAMMGPRLQGA